MCACAILVEGIYRNYFEFTHMVQEEITFERFLIWSSGSHPVQWSRTIYAIFVKSSVRNNSVNLFCIWTSGSGGDVVKSILSRALAVPLSRGGEPFVQFW